MISAVALPLPPATRHALLALGVYDLEDARQALANGEGPAVHKMRMAVCRRGS